MRTRSSLIEFFVLKIGVGYQRLQRTANTLSDARSSKILALYNKKIDQELERRGDLPAKEVESYRDQVGDYSDYLVESKEGEQGISGDDDNGSEDG